MVDILIFLFETYIHHEGFKPKYETMAKELEDTGFKRAQIVKAFMWLESLALYEKQRETLVASSEAHSRYFTAEEYQTLGKDGVNFIIYLEKNAHLSAMVREMIIDRAMALSNRTLPLEHLKWVALIIISFKCTDPEGTTWLQDIIFEDYEHQTLH